MTPLRRPILVAAFGMVQGAIAVMGGAMQAAELIADAIQHAAYAGHGVCGCRACVRAVLVDLKRHVPKGVN